MRSEQERAFALSAFTNGVPVPTICKDLKICEQTFYNWLAKKDQPQGAGPGRPMVKIGEMMRRIIVRTRLENPHTPIKFLAASLNISVRQFRRIMLEEKGGTNLHSHTTWTENACAQLVKEYQDKGTLTAVARDRNISRQALARPFKKVIPAVSPSLLSLCQVKDRLVCTMPYLYGLLRSKKIPSCKVGTKYYVEKEELERYQAAQKCTRCGTALPRGRRKNCSSRCAQAKAEKKRKPPCWMNKIAALAPIEAQTYVGTTEALAILSLNPSYLPQLIALELLPTLPAPTKPGRKPYGRRYSKEHCLAIAEIYRNRHQTP